MRVLCAWGVALVAVSLGFSSAEAEGEPDADAVAIAKLTPRVRKAWPADYPKCRWYWVRGSVPIPSAGEQLFKAEERGDGTLWVDTTGNGRLDKHLKQAALVTFRWRAGKASWSEYSLRFKPVYNRPDRERGWYFASGTTVEGKLGSSPVVIVDIDANGRYDDFGVDSLMLGKDAVPQPLQSLFVCRESVYSFDASEENLIPPLVPYPGEVGSVQLAKKGKARAQLADVVLVHSESQVRFPIENPRRPHPLPVGKYTLESARWVLGEHAASIETGSMSAIGVETGRIANPEWGAPYRFKFGAEWSDEWIAIVAPKEGHGSELYFVGAAGEQYRIVDAEKRKQRFEVEIRSSKRRERESGTVETIGRLVGRRFEAPANAETGVEVTVRLARTPLFGDVEGRVVVAPR